MERGYNHWEHRLPEIPQPQDRLFGVQVPAVNKHLKNIFESGELSEDSVISILETTADDGKRYCYRFLFSDNTF